MANRLRKIWRFWKLRIVMMGSWINHLKLNYLNNKPEMLMFLYKSIYLYKNYKSFSFYSGPIIGITTTNWKRERTQCGETSKVNNVTSQVEYSRHCLEQRQMNIEAFGCWGTDYFYKFSYWILFINYRYILF